jgi:hypothetical protein
MGSAPVLSDTPIAAAIAGCVIPLSRNSTIWTRWRCVTGIFHRSAVFNRRTSALLHLTICCPRRWRKRITPLGAKQPDYLSKTSSKSGHPRPQQISQRATWPVYSNRVVPRKAAADVSDWTIARRKGPRPARPYGTPYTRSALPPIVPNGGLLSMSRSDEYRRFAAECLKMAQTAEEEQNRATFYKWRECGLLSAAMTIQRIKCRSYLLLPQPLPQPLSKLLPFPAILFFRPPSVRISLGGGIRPQISGTVLMTVPRGNNHLSRRDVPEN